MQMEVPGGSVEYLPKNLFDQSLHSLDPETKPSDYRYASHSLLPEEKRHRSNKENTLPFFKDTKFEKETITLPDPGRFSKQKINDEVNRGFYLESDKHVPIENNGTSKESSALVKHMKFTNNRVSVGQTGIEPSQAHRLKNDGFELYSYNVTVSDQLPLKRDIPDTRPVGCGSLPAYTAENLARSTVIICFHNEALSVLLRTVHSVLGRTPRHLLEKVILVDDFSTQ
ncbi:unnamed protein product, partial [Candidula unifasciata]